MEPTGQHPAGWLHPRAQRDGATNFPHFAKMAQSAERAKFDFIFQADVPGARDGNMQALSRNPTFMNLFEPLTLLSGLAAVTTRIGLVGTSSTSYYEPYNLARQYASLDHISGGRSGWNVVTSAHPAPGYNFGRDGLEPHALRYKRAEEFVEVVKGLWDSWDDDAFPLDSESARYFDPEKMHYLNHRGEHFSVRGPLNIGRSPQGHPVLFQAGGSEAGKRLAAETAEVVFSLSPTLEGGAAFYSEIKARMAAAGRPPEACVLCVGLGVTVAGTQAQAEDKYAELEARLHPEVMLEALSNDLEVDLSDVPIDAPVPLDRLPKEANQHKSYFEKAIRVLSEGPMTMRELYRRFGANRGGRQIIGSVDQVADSMQAWFEAEAADGFMLYFAGPDGMDDFGDLVVPELQRRGLFRVDYDSRTLRGHLGLPRPISRYVSA